MSFLIIFDVYFCVYFFYKVYNYNIIVCGITYYYKVEGFLRLVF